MKDYSKIQEIGGLIRVGQPGASVDVRVQWYEYRRLHVGAKSASGRLLALNEPTDMVKVVETRLLRFDRPNLFRH